MTCPVCDGPLDATRYHEQYAGAPVLSEEFIHCPQCGYESDFRYGAHTESIDGHHYCWDHHTPVEIVTATEVRIAAAINAARAAWRATPNSEVASS